MLLLFVLSKDDWCLVRPYVAVTKIWEKCLNEGRFIWAPGFSGFGAGLLALLLWEVQYHSGRRTERRS